MPSLPVFVAVCDDHTVFRRQLVIAIEAQQQIWGSVASETVSNGAVVIAEADLPGRLPSLLEELVPDVVLVDLSPPSGEFDRAFAALVERLPDTAVGVLAGPTDDPGPALLAGAVGSIDKRHAIGQISDVVQTLADGLPWLDQRGATAVVEALEALEAVTSVPVGSADRELLGQVSAGRSLAELEPFLGRRPEELGQALSEVLATVRAAWRTYADDSGHTLHRSTPGTTVDSTTG